MADITAEDGFTYYEGGEDSTIAVGGFTYIDDSTATGEFTYIGSVVFFTFLIP